MKTCRRNVATVFASTLWIVSSYYICTLSSFLTHIIHACDSLSSLQKWELRHLCKSTISWMLRWSATLQKFRGESVNLIYISLCVRAEKRIELTYSFCVKLTARRRNWIAIQRLLFRNFTEKNGFRFTTFEARSSKDRSCGHKIKLLSLSNAVRKRFHVDLHNSSLLLSRHRYHFPVLEKDPGAVKLNPLRVMVQEQMR